VLLLLLQGIFQGLYFGVGQGLGALIGGLLKQRYGGQAMFGLCSGIIFLAWLAVVAAEQLFSSSSSSSEGEGSLDSAHGVKAGSTDSNSSSTAGQAVQPLPGVNALQRVQAWGQELWYKVAGGAKGSNTVGPRQRKQLYMELSGKDSGPDLGVGLSNQQQQQQLGTELPR
jgi:MFS family permease